MSFDLSWRPNSYWSDAYYLNGLEGSISGTVRRELLKASPSSEEALSYIEPLLVESLSNEQLKQWTRLHPSHMGGEYLPERNHGQVEIARIEFASVTADVISIRAMPHRYGIRISIVDEYESSYAFGPRWRRKPLTLKQMIKLINTTRNPFLDESCPKGLVFPSLVWLFEETGEPQDLLSYVRVRSSIYPELEPYFEAKKRVLQRKKLRERAMGY